MGFIDIHTHHEPVLADVTSILHCAPNQVTTQRPFSVGIHPWFIKKEQVEREFKLLEEALYHEHCLAIGECGLDKMTEVDFDVQIKVFERQIELSEKYEKPIIIHCVRAYSELMALRKRSQPKQVWIIHGFRKNHQLAKQLLDHDILLSFGAALMYDTKLQTLVEDLPLNSFFLETDDDKSISIESIYQQVAKVKQRSVIEIKENISNNFNTIFIR